MEEVEVSPPADADRAADRSVSKHVRRYLQAYLYVYVDAGGKQQGDGGDVGLMPGNRIPSVAPVQ